MYRRAFLTIGAGAVLIASTRLGLSQPTEDAIIIGEIPPLPDDLVSEALSPPASYIETQVVGTAAPKDEEIASAYLILSRSPYACSPIEVAEYFLQVGSGVYGADVRKYAREWPVRANPVIYHFFSSTQTKPEGDETAWCAAFMNWCILRSHATEKDEFGKSPGTFSKSGKPFNVENFKKHSTNSASSGSFRCWKETNAPKRGELVVFKDEGTDGATKHCLGQGHVAFFLQVPNKDVVQVVGGNQTSAGSGGAITVANMSTAPGSRFMKYVLLQ
ncbi:CHAP domain-containing protein [Phyllobacterium pellucidum]|uniref:CHAP domain-containing protein n=1 Tax=Phyllobacterium pellucidum TaxID=2740464 RepID=UPI001D1572C0|nr:CHAP domain-containing protein [Phyllobacterium sp. T1018]UGY11149.1 CHAP domain-containing protein [Phyllobacterium sp. T1018]